MAPTFTVVYDLGATTAVVLDAPEGTTPEQLIEMADPKVDASLCHQCAHRITLGDPTALVIDEGNETIWDADDETVGEVL